MFKYILGRFRKKPVRKNYLPVPDGYTLQEWRANTELSSHLKTIMDEAAMRHALSVLYNQIPSGFPLRGEPINETQAAVELGRQNGYLECLSLFKSLAILPTTQTEVEQTYGAEHTDNWN